MSRFNGNNNKDLSDKINSLQTIVDKRIGETVVTPKPIDLSNKSSKTPSQASTIIFVPDIPLTTAGVVTMKVKAAASNATIIFLKKIDSANFQILSKKEVTLTEGVNVVNTGFVSNGDGSQYIGFYVQENLYYGSYQGTGYYETPKVADLNVSTVAINKKNVGADVAMSFEIATSQFNQLLATDASLAEEISNVKIKQQNILPKVLNMPRYLVSKNISDNFFSQSYFLGRWTKKTINSIESMYTINMGSAIFMKVKGTTTVTLKFQNISNTTGTTPGAPAVIAYSVDGGDYVRVGVDKAPINITGLDTNEHYIRVVVAGTNDQDQLWSNDQGVAFTGITVDSGATVEAVKPKAKIGLFYGDSITAGCWLLNKGTNATSHGAEQNYVEKCCNLLRAINVRVAFSAAGVTKAGSGGVPVMPTYIDKMDANTNETSDVPDFIVINIGQNDSAATSSAFQTALQTCVDRIQIKYPGVTIFTLLPFSGARKTEIQAVSNASKNTVFIDTTGWGITYTDGAHPDAAGSSVAGTKLAQILLDYYGKAYFTN